MGTSSLRPTNYTTTHRTETTTATEYRDNHATHGKISPIAENYDCWRNGIETQGLSHLLPQNREHAGWKIKLCSIVLRKHQYTTPRLEQSLLTNAWSNPIVKMIPEISLKRVN